MLALQHEAPAKPPPPKQHHPSLIGLLDEIVIPAINDPHLATPGAERALVAQERFAMIKYPDGLDRTPVLSGQLRQTPCSQGVVLLEHQVPMFPVAVAMTVQDEPALLAAGAHAASGLPGAAQLAAPGARTRKVLGQDGEVTQVGVTIAVKIGCLVGGRGCGPEHMG